MIENLGLNINNSPRLVIMTDIMDLWRKTEFNLITHLFSIHMLKYKQL